MNQSYPHPDLFSLREGDTVWHVGDDGSLTARTVKYLPWQLGHGQWVIGLCGIAGGIAIERIQLSSEPVQFQKTSDMNGREVNEVGKRFRPRRPSYQARHGKKGGGK